MPIQTKTEYFSLQGRINFGKRQADGSIGATRWAFNVPRFDIALEVEDSEHKESWSGSKAIDDVDTTASNVSWEMDIEGADPSNLALALHAARTDVVAGTVTDELLPADLIAGDLFKLDFPRISALVLTDSNATPATLVEGTNYAIESAFAGMAGLLDISALTPPFKAAYSYAETINLAIFKQRPAEFWIVFDGVNTKNDSRVLVDLYRNKPSPIASLPLINNEGLLSMTMSGRTLFDGAKEADPVFGGYGRLVLPGVAP